jgi:hypothetical protein
VTLWLDWHTTSRALLDSLQLSHRKLKDHLVELDHEFDLYCPQFMGFCLHGPWAYAVTVLVSKSHNAPTARTESWSQQPLASLPRRVTLCCALDSLLQVTLCFQGILSHMIHHTGSVVWMASSLSSSITSTR